MPDWDVAFSSDRRPRGHQSAAAATKPAIFHAFADQTIGFITYSEGCNDDVNKIVWSAARLGPGSRPARRPAQLQPLLDRPGRSRRGRLCARAFCALEQNWRGPLVIQRLGRDDAPAVPAPGTPRRARTSCRLAVPAGALPRVLRRLRPQPPDLRDRPRGAGTGSTAQRASMGSCAAMGQAEAILDRAVTQPVAATCVRGLRAGRGTFQSIRMQLSVPRYKAIASAGAHPRHDRPGLERPALAQAAVRGDPQARQRAGAARGARRDRELDQPRARRILRRSGRPAAPAPSRLRVCGTTKILPRFTAR